VGALPPPTTLPPEEELTTASFMARSFLTLSSKKSVGIFSPLAEVKDGEFSCECPTYGS
jgi:hypothetical protein